jgi:hypothetical protein
MLLQLVQLAQHSVFSGQQFLEVLCWAKNSSQHPFSPNIQVLVQQRTGQQQQQQQT